MVLSIFEKHLKRIYRYFYYKTFSKEEAEDLTSETFLQFVRKVRGSQSEITTPDNYLYGIARNIFRTFLRNKYKVSFVTMLQLPDFARELETADDTGVVDMKARVKELIEQLPVKQRDIIRMRLIEGKTISDIMASTGKNENYVKTTQKRAIRSLKKLLACTPGST